MASAKVTIMVDGVLTEALVRTDEDGGILVYCKTGRIIKFPADVDLKDAIKKHNEANKDIPIAATDDVAEEDTELNDFLGVETADVKPEAEEK